MALWVAAMPHYRLYTLGRGNRISQAVDLDCETDAEAIEKARALYPRDPIELWQGKRLVKRIETT